MKYIVPIGRVLFSLIFIMSDFTHFSKTTIGYAESQGVPLASITVPLSGLIAIAGGLSIAVGLRTKFGAWLIVLFLIPVTFAMHAFWKAQDPMM
jgi:putative oxidoreductase